MLLLHHITSSAIIFHTLNSSLRYTICPRHPATVPLSPRRVFLPAADIPRFVALGSVALGITGQDVIAESTHASEISELLPLGFGKCSLQVQVPVTGPLQTIEDLSGGRIATSFEVLAGELFGKVDKDAGKGKVTRVEYVGGSVEAACALGMADGIGEYIASRLIVAVWLISVRTVDLVGEGYSSIEGQKIADIDAESGDTMRAAGLHPIHTLLTSEAVLITSRSPHPSLTPELSPLIPLIKSRFAGVIAAKKFVYASYNINRSKLADALAITPGRRAPTVSPLDEEGWVAVSAMVERKNMANVMDKLESVGAEDVLIFALDNCRVGI
jgi:ATP phosphoribosyltransferase